MSIQQSLNGHSFSVAGLTAVQGSSPVEVEICSARTLLVPAELFVPTEAAALLAAAGLAAHADEEVVWSTLPAASEATETAASQTTSEATVAVMAAPREVLAQVRAAVTGELCYTSPLLHEPRMTRPTLWLRRTGGLIYIKVYARGLKMAEVLPTGDETEVRYFVERLSTLYTLQRYQLQLDGAESKPLRHLLSPYFKQTLCVL